jgi:hypothetical protein
MYLPQKEPTNNIKKITTTKTTKRTKTNLCFEMYLSQETSIKIAATATTTTKTKRTKTST